MAVQLTPQAGGSVVPEAAAYNSRTNRQDQLVNGEIVPVFTGYIDWKVTDYLVDASGKKVGIVQSDPMVGPMAQQDQNKQGNIYLDPAAFLAALAANPALATAYQTVADFEDSLVRAELVKRNLITT